MQLQRQSIERKQWEAERGGDYCFHFFAQMFDVGSVVDIAYSLGKRGEVMRERVMFYAKGVDKSGS